MTLLLQWPGVQIHCIDFGIPVKKTSSFVTVFLYFELHRSIMNVLKEKKQSTIKIE